MEDGIWILLNILLVMILVLLNGFFIATEFALVKARDTRISELVKEGSKRAKIAQHVLSRLDAYLLSSKLGITLVSIALGWMGVNAIAHLIIEPLMVNLGASEYLVTPISFGIAFGIITFLHVVFGVFAPKSIALDKAEGTLLSISGPLMLFHKIAYPFILLFDGLAKKIVSWFGIRSTSSLVSGYNKEEILVLINESKNHGHIDKNELQLLENIFSFSERVAREIMVPRTMFNCIYVDLTFEENLQIIQKSRHTRFPIAEGDKDHIIGWVHASDIYNIALSEKNKHQQIKSFIRPLMIVPESLEISKILETMQNEDIQMVSVHDEYGGTSGIITLEDVIEEIIGDINDGVREERPEVEVLNNITSIDPRMLIEEVNEMFHINIEDDEVDTIGGWIYVQLNETPTVGDIIHFEQLKFEITEVEHLRIKRIIVNTVPRIDDSLTTDELQDVLNDNNEVSA